MFKFRFGCVKLHTTCLCMVSCVVG